MSLLLTFHHFRCWEHLELEIPLGQITLIKGKSGGGKSTILRGIIWCLYGNMRLVNPKHLQRAATYVQINLPYTLNDQTGILTIRRQKHPNRLMVTFQDQTYEDKVAQSLLNDIFGSYTVWAASCYIGQKCLNTFLTAPNAGKMELLNNIAFHEEDPATFIQTIDQSISDKNQTYNQQLARYNVNLERLQRVLSEVDTAKALSADQVEMINANMDTLQREITSLQELNINRKVNVGMLQRLEQQLDHLPPPQIVSPMMNIHQQPIPVDQVESYIESILNLIPLIQRRTDLQIKIQSYDSQLSTMSPEKTYTDADYQQALKIETTRYNYERQTAALNLAYDPAVIQQTIQHYQSMLDSQDRLQLEHSRLQMQSRMESLQAEPIVPPISIPEIIPIEIAPPDESKFSTQDLNDQLTQLIRQQGELQSQLEHLHRGMDILKCPQCSVSVRYRNNQLHLVDGDPVDQTEIESTQIKLGQTQNQIQQLKSNISSKESDRRTAQIEYQHQLKQEQQRVDDLRSQAEQLKLQHQRQMIQAQTRALEVERMQTQIDQIDRQLSTMDPAPTSHVLSSDQMNNLRTAIAQLSSIEYIQAPSVSSSTIQSYLKYQQMQDDVAAIAQLEIPEPWSTYTLEQIHQYIRNIRGQWSQLKSQLESERQTKQTRSELESQIKHLRENLPSDPTADIQQKTSQLQHHQQSLIDSETAHAALQLHQTVTEERQGVIEIGGELSIIRTLRQHAIETECKILEQIVGNINASIDHVCTSLFDQDITINLNLFQTLKTTKVVKPRVNFTIHHKGGIYDNVGQMSGGEEDRVSLALTLALSRLSGCPLLMLDETLSAIDLNMKEVAIRTIRQCTDKTVLVIIHDGIEGIFDHVTDVEEYTTCKY